MPTNKIKHGFLSKKYCIFNFFYQVVKTGLIKMTVQFCWYSKSFGNIFAAIKYIIQ